MIAGDCEADLHKPDVDAECPPVEAPEVEKSEDVNSPSSIKKPSNVRVNGYNWSPHYSDGDYGNQMGLSEIATGLQSILKF